jgi:hypothetical protein
MTQLSTEYDTTTLIVRPWADPVVEAIGHDPTSDYVELFWLGTLGPTATWLLRRLDAGLRTFPEGYELDLAETAMALGLSFTPGSSGPFTRSLSRLVMFGLAQPLTRGLAVRRKIPPLSQRQLARLPHHLRLLHDAGRPAREPGCSPMTETH